MTALPLVGQPPRRRHSRRRRGQAQDHASRTSSSAPSSSGSPSATRASRWAGSTAATPTTGTSSTAASWRVTLAVATLLTVYSFVLYLYRNRATVLSPRPVTRPRVPALMNLELVTIGTELLLGFTSTPTARRSRGRCAAIGVQRGAANRRRPTARRRFARLSRAALARTGAVLTTGGLGPDPRRHHQEGGRRPLRHAARLRRAGFGDTLLERFARLGRTPVAEQSEPGRGADGRRRCCRNRWGTAPGLWLEGAPGLAIMLPGSAARDAEAARARGGSRA